MKKYTIVITGGKKGTDTISFKSYKKLNQTFERLVCSKPEHIKVSRYLGKELIETV